MPDIDSFRAKAGRSPFDEIMHAEEDGTGWWSAREMMPYLGYSNWANMEAVVARAKSACRNTGRPVAENFAEVSKVSGSRGPSRKDHQLTRFGCYLVAMNGDPDKPEIAAAQAYFVVQTRRAEVLLPEPSAPVPGQILAWSQRFRVSSLPHGRHVTMNFGPSAWTVVTQCLSFMLCLEDQIARHMMALGGGDRPDVSVGLRWAKERRRLGLSDVPADRKAPLHLPDVQRVVWTNVYPDEERKRFCEWFDASYLPLFLPEYMDHKPEFKSYGRLPPASAADNTCKTLTGRPAAIRPLERKQLAAAGGFFPAGRPLPQLPSERGLFD